MKLRADTGWRGVFIIYESSHNFQYIKILCRIIHIFNKIKTHFIPIKIIILTNKKHK